MDTTSWQTQLRKGAAELVVLASLRGGERYGLEILEQAGGEGGVLSDGTLYPLLTRLEREGKVEARWVIGTDAKVPRKYYHLTPEGEELTAEMRSVWFEFSAFVSGALEEVANESRTAPQRRTVSGKT